VGIQLWYSLEPTLDPWTKLGNKEVRNGYPYKQNESNLKGGYNPKMETSTKKEKRKEK
jgi:hypothetical protein